MTATYDLSLVPRWQRLRGAGPLLIVATIVLVLMVLVACLAPLIAPYAPNQTDILAANRGPSPAHLLGTDSLGRDIYSRLLFGARLTLLGPTLIIVIATLAGVALAISAVWFGGWYDAAVSRTLNVLFALPGLLVAIIAVAVIGPGLAAPVVALSLAYMPYIARVLRSVALRERSLAYVEAGQLVGLSGWAVCRRHLLPNVMPIIRAQATLAFGSALVDLAAVSYLGLGVQPPTAEWGVMVASGQSSLLNGYPWESLSAGVAIVFVVVLVNLVGERLALRAERAP
ncbi:MAG: peptide/nickel transport system permease protein [Actinomycetota bacterium]|jgi:peptide/nickel transport system permease protein|nr:peptide/nickel transport system permease protein [Actinomycetota bacterium]